MRIATSEEGDTLATHPLLQSPGDSLEPFSQWKSWPKGDSEDDIVKEKETKRVEKGIQLHVEKNEEKGKEGGRPASIGTVAKAQPPTSCLSCSPLHSTVLAGLALDPCAQRKEQCGNIKKQFPRSTLHYDASLQMIDVRRCKENKIHCTASQSAEASSLCRQSLQYFILGQSPEEACTQIYSLAF